METLLATLANPSEMGKTQVLLLAIILFVLIGSFYFVWRIYRIIITARKNTYVPNIGLKRAGLNAGTGSIKPPEKVRPAE